MRTTVLFWEPCAVGQRVAPNGTDDLGDSLRKLVETFGPEPRRITPVELAKSHVMTLRAMGGGVFETLANLIEQNGKIRVWGQE